MSRYLVVAHQTAGSPELRQEIAATISQEPEAEFTVLAPATPINHLLTWSDTESREAASHNAEEAAQLMRAEGANVSRVAVGSQSAISAIKDELRDHPGAYDAMIICTFPAGASRWLKADLLSQARRLGLPVTHVTASRVPAGMKAR